MTSSCIDKFVGEHRFLSNFYPASVCLGGQEFKSVEAAYQAAKTDDPCMRERIRQAATPSHAKQLGKTLRLSGDWESHKLVVMEGLVQQKFERHSELADKLLATADKELVEGNWWGDRFWGVCNGTGENHLGKILMKVREHLRCSIIV